MHHLDYTACHGSRFDWGTRTFIMGIVNVSPDSFSGDGSSSVEKAVIRATRLAAEGADIIDIGGESTRPGAAPTSAEIEIRRVVPVIARLRRTLEIPISIDTSKYEVAHAAAIEGANMINDIRGLQEDIRLAILAAEQDLSIIVTANQRGRPVTGDIMAKVTYDLRCAVRRCKNAGVPSRNIIVDPGIGFGKTSAQDLEIIRRLGELGALGYPILLGPSRKSFIGFALGLPEDERLEGTASAVAIGIANGANIIRVHDVKEMARVARISDAIAKGSPA